MAESCITSPKMLPAGMEEEEEEEEEEDEGESDVEEEEEDEEEEKDEEEEDGGTLRLSSSLSFDHLLTSSVISMSSFVLELVELSRSFLAKFSAATSCLADRMQLQASLERYSLPCGTFP